MFSIAANVSEGAIAGSLDCPYGNYWDTTMSMGRLLGLPVSSP